MNTYSMIGLAVAIDDGVTVALYNYESVQAALDTIVKNHDFYGTQEAFERDLSTFQGAMSYLRENLTIGELIPDPANRQQAAWAKLGRVGM